MIHTLVYVAGIVSLICFVLMMISMYQHKQTAIMIICIVLVFIYGVGCLIALVYGWMMAKSWRLQPMLYVWTGAVLVLLVFFKDVNAMLPSWR